MTKTDKTIKSLSLKIKTATANLKKMQKQFVTLKTKAKSEKKVAKKVKKTARPKAKAQKSPKRRSHKKQAEV
jgi:hypothetical protein